MLPSVLKQVSVYPGGFLQMDNAVGGFDFSTSHSVSNTFQIIDASYLIILMFSLFFTSHFRLQMSRK